MLRIAFFFLAFLLCDAGLLAQSDRGQIAGTVRDARQASIPVASVQARSLATGFQREQLTNALGQYRFVQLDPGVYEITARSSGFTVSSAQAVELPAGFALRVDLVLNTGFTAASVETGNPLLSVLAPMQSVHLGAKAISRLPISGRRFHDLALLTPTVQVDPQRGQLSVAGQRGIYSSIILDGGDYGEPFLGGVRGGDRSSSSFTVPQSAIQEVQMVVSGYSAEFGRSTGGVLNAVSRSGSNTMHGEAFYQLRHKELGRKDPVQLLSMLETLHQWGVSLGGAARRDRFFLFAAAERQDSTTPRQVLFTQLIGRAPTAGTGEALSFLRSEEKPFLQTNDAIAFLLRADHHTARGDRRMLRYNFSDAKAANAVSAAGVLSPFVNRSMSNDGTEKDRTHTGAAQFTRVLSPLLVNEARLTGSYEVRPRLANSAMPQVDFRTIGSFGGRNFLPAMQDDLRMQLSDGLSMQLGTHAIKAGFDYSLVSASQLSGSNQFGAFTITSPNVETILQILSVGGSIPNRFDDASVTYARQIGNLSTSLRMHQAAAYVQDNWRIRNNLTLDFGLRWEGQFNPAPEATNTALAELVRSVRFPNGARLDPSLIPDATRQVMPRFGAAWTPFPASRRILVRGHAGLFYAATPLVLFAGPVNNFRLVPGDLSIALSPMNGQSVYSQLLAAGIDLNQFGLDQLPVIAMETVQRASSLSAGGTKDPFAGAALAAVGNDFRNPRAAQAGFGIDSEITRNLSFGAQFNYLNAVNLVRNRDYNLPAPALRPNDVSLRPFYGLRSSGMRPIASLSSIIARESSARSMFRSVTLSAQHRAGRFLYGAFYTWAENFSDDDSERDTTAISYSNSFDLRGDYGLARGDIRHQFAGYFVFSLPLGFEAAGTVRARGGVPVNAIAGMDLDEDLIANDRPYPEPGLPLSRNSFRNRKVIHGDLRLMKSFSLGSDVRRLQFSAEFFNLADINNVVFAGVNGGATGGVSGGAYGPGIATTGQYIPVDPRFLRLRMPDGSYDRTNMQAGTPLLVQFGLRFLF